ncbi:MAG: diacylglycerol kinase family lipid kinase [Magnetospirillum sp. WYHS-4]
MLQQHCNIGGEIALSQADLRRILLIRNPTAGGWRARRFASVLKRLEGLGCRVTVRDTAARGDAEALSRAATSADFDLVAVAGGDGTLSEAANGLAASGSGLPLAVVPLGTANVLAHEIGMPFDADGIARVLATGTPRPVYPGIANGRLFLQMAGIGFDAHAVAAVSLPLKRRLGKAAYILAVLKVLARPFATCRIEVDGKTFEAASAIVAKGHFYGGRFVFCPGARLEAGTLEVCLLPRTGILNFLRYLTAFGLGAVHRLSDVRVVRGRRLRIEGPTGEPVQGDGDLLTTLPLTIEVRDEPLALIYP